jgi:hypothetical protein
MTQVPVNDEIAAALAGFFFGGAGPSHTRLSTVFVGAGYSADDPYSPVAQTPNKETRVLTVMRAAQRRPERARDLVDALLTQLRVHGCFDAGRSAVHEPNRVRAVQRAFRPTGWQLSDDGYLSTTGSIDLTTGGRAALEEQVARLRRATDDPGQLLGSAKDLLESVAKFVLEEFGVPTKRHDDFDHLWYLARERLNVLPAQVDSGLPGANSIKAILQSSWTIAEQVNKLRGVQGTGHGRTLPTGVSAEMALMVVREACSVAEFMLARLDRAMGRAA